MGPFEREERREERVRVRESTEFQICATKILNFSDFSEYFKIHSF